MTDSIDLIGKLLEALSTPGIPRECIFPPGAGSDVFAYSAYPEDPSFLVRESIDGEKVLGVMNSSGQFQIIRIL